MLNLVTDFGASEASADNTAALNTAFSTCYANGKTLYIPSGVYKFLSPISTPPLSIIGDGKFTTSLQYCGASVSSPLVFLVSAPSVGIKLDSFSLDFAVDGISEHALQIKLQAGGFFSNYIIQNCQFGRSLLQALYLDNSVGNGDGFFCGTVRNCLSWNGIKGEKIGDNVEFSSNVGTTVSASIGNTCFGLDISSIPGARQMTIRNNNITTTGGALRLSNVEQPCIENNQFEYPWYRGIPYTGVDNSFIVFSNVEKATFSCNTVGTGSASSPLTPALAIKCSAATKFCKFYNNDIYSGTSGHFFFTAGAYGNAIGSGNTWGIDHEPKVSFADPMLYPQIGIDLPLKLINNWQLDEDFGYKDCVIRLSEDGFCNVIGAVKNGAGNIAILPPMLTAKFARSITTYQGSTTSFCTVQINPGMGQPIQLASSPGTSASLTGLRFRYFLN